MGIFTKRRKKHWAPASAGATKYQAIPHIGERVGRGIPLSNDVSGKGIAPDDEV